MKVKIEPQKYKAFGCFAETVVVFVIFSSSKLLKSYHIKIMAPQPLSLLSFPGDSRLKSKPWSIVKITKIVESVNDKRCRKNRLYIMHKNGMVHKKGENPLWEIPLIVKALFFGEFKVKTIF